jgi:hydrogenase maturation protease
MKTSEYTCPVLAKTPTTDAQKKTYVLGLGNVLMGDDGFGPAVIRAFETEYIVSPEINGVEVVDLGTPGLDLTPWLADAERVVIVDTVKSAAPAGTLRVYNKHDVMRHGPPDRVGSHDPGVKETLLRLEFAGRGPEEVTLIGVVPARVASGVQLSCELESAVPRAVGAIVAELERQGIEVHRRANLRTNPPWWAV